MTGDFFLNLSVLYGDSVHHVTWTACRSCTTTTTIKLLYVLSVGMCSPICREECWYVVVVDVHARLASPHNTRYRGYQMSILNRRLGNNPFVSKTIIIIIPMFFRIIPTTKSTVDFDSERDLLLGTGLFQGKVPFFFSRDLF